MKPSDDKIPEEMRNRIMEQMPWLKNPNNLIPIVNPDDLKSLYKLQNDLVAKHGQPGKTVVVGGEVAKRALSPGANLGDLIYRLGWIGQLKEWSEARPLEFPWIHDGKIDDAVFKALAILPMSELPPSGRGPFPFDAEELMGLIKKESEA